MRHLIHCPTCGTLTATVILPSNEPVTDLEDFLSARCQLGLGLVTEAAVLYEAYTDWATSAGATPVTPKAFGMALGAAGLGRRRGAKGVRRYVGIGLKPASQKRASQPRTVH